MFNGWTAYYEDEPVISGGIDYYKITFPLVKLGEASDETGEKTREKVILYIAKFSDSFNNKISINPLPSIYHP